MKIKDISLTLNGHTCKYNEVYLSGAIMRSTCTADNNCLAAVCELIGGGACPSTDSQLVRKDETVRVVSQTPTTDTTWTDDPCKNIRPKENYYAKVDITYDINIGKAISTKHSVGTINIYPQQAS
jgi:hypothetical protein